MNAQELKEKYWSLYEYMANSKDPKNMKTFGRVMTTMMDDMIQSSPSKAEEYIGKLESIKWNQYLTPTEAEKVAASLEPKAPWSREQWRQAMEDSSLPLEEWPCYNSCALWVTMNSIMSKSSETLSKYVGKEDLFKAVYDLAVDNLKDPKYMIRHMYGL